MLDMFDFGKDQEGQDQEGQEPAPAQMNSEQDIFKDIFGTASEDHVTDTKQKERVTRPTRDTSVYTEAYSLW